MKRKLSYLVVVESKKEASFVASKIKRLGFIVHYNETEEKKNVIFIGGYYDRDGDYMPTGSITPILSYSWLKNSSLNKHNKLLTIEEFKLLPEIVVNERLFGVDGLLHL